MIDTTSPYKVVIQLSQNDLHLQKAALGQINNLLKDLENIYVELVTHSSGLNLLLKNTPLFDSIEKLHDKGVVFLVCQNALNSQRLEKKDVIPLAKIIPSAVAHLVKRQTEGWSYLRIA